MVDTHADRVAVITGAASGFGRAIAMELARRGAAVVAVDVNPVDDVVAEIERLGGKGLALRADVSEPDAVAAVGNDAMAFGGGVDILVNNAGITRDGLALRMKAVDFEEVLRANLTGAFLLTQALLQGMMKARWGRILNITSVVGETGAAGQANYAASKAGLIGLTKSLAREFASRNITVNAIAPGFVQTAMTDVLTDDQRTGILAQIPLARYGSVDDIAAAATFLASEGAGYITGHTLDVNGGMYMG